MTGSVSSVLCECSQRKCVFVQISGFFNQGKNKIPTSHSENDLKRWRCILADDRARLECQVISEASDGSEAIQNAEELKPDLILLDIGLPKMNGIEAARRIRQLCPNSKIVFLSQNNDLDVVRAALGTGAFGLRLQDRYRKRTTACHRCGSSW
jgi:CheY-like chemotaxis protein